MKIPGELRPIFATIKAQGWTIKRTTRGHWQCIPPDKEKPIVVHAISSTGRRGLQNFVADLRRSGLTYPPLS